MTVSGRTHHLLWFFCFLTIAGCRTTEDSQTNDAVAMERELGLSLEASLQKGKEALDRVADEIDSLRRAGDRENPAAPSVIRVSPEMLTNLESSTDRLRETMLELYTKLDGPNAQPDSFFQAVPREVFENVVVRNLWRLISETEGAGGLRAGLLMQMEQQITAYKSELEVYRSNPGTAKVDLERPRRRLINLAEQALVAGNAAVHEVTTWRYRERSATPLSKVLTTFCAGHEAANDEDANADVQRKCGPEGSLASIMASFATAAPERNVVISNFSIPELRRVNTGIFAGRSSYHSWPEATLSVEAPEGRQIVTEVGPEIRVTERGKIFGESASSKAIASWLVDCQSKLKRLSQETREAGNRFLAAAVCMAPETDCTDEDCTQVTAHSRILFYYLAAD